MIGVWELAFPGEPFPSPAEADRRLVRFVGDLIDRRVTAAERDRRMRRAHALLLQAIRNPHANRFLVEAHGGLRDAYDVLCWALGHEEKNPGFACLLGLVEATLRGMREDPMETQEAEDENDE